MQLEPARRPILTKKWFVSTALTTIVSVYLSTGLCGCLKTSFSANAGKSLFDGHAQGPLSSQSTASAASARSPTVIGLSSGGFMAAQLAVSYSSIFKNIGIFAGGIYDCAQGSVMGAYNCANCPEMIYPPFYVNLARLRENLGQIDPLVLMKGQKIFIFAGENDKTISPAGARKAEEFFEFLGARVVNQLNPGTAHVMPTKQYGGPCNKSQSPWIASCGYDGAGAALTSFWQDLLPPVPSVAAHLRRFDQTPFITVKAAMGQQGYVYRPASCSVKSSSCSLLVALHGCEQSIDKLGAEFSTRAGFNEWAEANRIEFLYPSMAATANNPHACWDWWGFTGQNYAVREGAQMIAIKKIVEAAQQNRLSIVN